MTEIRVGCAITDVFGKQQVEDNLPTVLRAVKEAGYDGVESVGPLCNGDGVAAARLLRDNGLVQWSVHIYPFDKIDEIDAYIEYANTVGGKFVVVSGLESNYDDAASTLNRVGGHCKEAGLTFCHHTYSSDFKDQGGTTGIEQLMAGTDPANVKLCVDTFWVRHGGQDPVQFIRRHLDRVAFLHLKDLEYIGPEPRKDGVLAIKDVEFVELGRGEIDFPGIWRLVEPLGHPWVVYEQDRTALSPVESSAISRRYLRDRLGI